MRKRKKGRGWRGWRKELLHSEMTGWSGGSGDMHMDGCFKGGRGGSPVIKARP